MRFAVMSRLALFFWGACTKERTPPNKKLAVFMRKPRQHPSEERLDLPP